MSKRTRLFALAWTLVACGQDSFGTSEDEFRSKPTGTDTSLGNFRIVAPPGQTARVFLKPLTEETKLTDEKALGDIFEGLKIGRLRFQVNADWEDGQRAASDGSFMIEAGKLTELHFGGLAVRTKDIPSTLGVAGFLSKTFGITFRREPKLADATYNSNMEVGVDNPGMTASPLHAGRYVARWGLKNVNSSALVDGVAVDLVEDKVSTIDLWSYDQRSVIRVIPAHGELPTASACNGAMRVAYDKFDGNNRNSSNGLDVPKDEPIEIGVNPSLLSTPQTPSKLIYNLPCVDLDIYSVQEFPEVGKQVDLKIGRIDVEDVTLTASDGSQTTVAGTYRVMREGENSNILSQELPTNTGVDLPPGTYRLEVRYPTANGTFQTYEETFTTPP